MPRIFIQRDTHKDLVASLGPFLRESLLHNCFMDTERMEPGDIATCRWLGFGIGKGVTHPERDVSVYATPEQVHTGLHGKMAQGFADIPVDPTPFCYELDHELGFGGFVRWVQFADPNGKADFVGVDWSGHLRPSHGVAHTMLRAWETADALARHGIPLQQELVLLNWKMCEPPEARLWRQTHQLITLEDWVQRGPQLFSPKSPMCPRCGHETLKGRARFCSACGCSPKYVRQQHRSFSHGLQA